MSVPKLSIIIPIFGAEKYISKCLDSLVNQTYGIENLEIICVNDCTLDNSMQIVKDFQNQYPNRITIHNHKKNKGPGGARNTGLKIATGDYITFADPDDYLELDTYDYIISNMKNTNIQLACFNFIFFNSTSHFTKPLHPSNPIFKKEIKISHKELYTNYPKFIHSLSVWNKIYSKDLLKNIDSFPENQLFNEDAKFSLDCFLAASEIFITPRRFYNYRKDENNSAATNKSYTTKKSYFFHLKHHQYLEKIKSIYPSLKEEINIFHINNWYQFMHNILIKKPISFNKQEMLFFYNETKKIYSTINLSDYKNKTHPIQRLIPLSFKYSFSFQSAKILYFTLHKLAKFFHGIYIKIKKTRAQK